MGRLTEQDELGNWMLKGVAWKELYEGQVMTSKLWNYLYGALCKLKDYENTGLDPIQIERMDQMYLEKCREVNCLKKANSWIPVEERLPEDGTYLCTLDGELCGLDESFTGMCGIENGKWDEEGCVIAWQPLPEPYREDDE